MERDRNENRRENRKLLLSTNSNMNGFRKREPDKMEEEKETENKGERSK